MDKELRALLQDYLIGSQTVEAIRLWLAHNIWEASIDQDSLVDHVAIELAHLTDGLTDELYFHSQVRGMIWLLPDDEVVQEIILAGTNNAVPIPEGTYDQSSQVITMVHSFA